MKISEIKGVDAIDVIADIIDPITAIMADIEIKKAAQAKKPTIVIVKLLLKRHKESILEILAYLNNENPKDFKPSLLELTVMLVSLINEISDNKELMSLFLSQPQMMASVSSGTVMVNTEETETI